MSKILLSGIPGTGKTTVSRYIETELGFCHVDMERNGFAPRQAFREDKQKFLGELAVHDDVLISWGFGPFEDKASVEYITEQGYTMVWLDGDRAAAYRQFMKREENDPVMEAIYYGQMQMVVVTGIVDALKPMIINPFTVQGEFRPVEDIARQIVQVGDKSEH